MTGQYYLEQMETGPVYTFVEEGKQAAVLTVSDVVELAKAGVQVSFKDVQMQIVPNPHNNRRIVRSLEDSFWERWQRANPRDPNSFGVIPSFMVMAHRAGDKVYLAVAPTDHPTFILEDEAVLFPSDALMAKLALWERNK